MATPLPQMLTANRLVDGDVVYWRTGGWTEAFGEGEVFSAEADAESALEAAKKSVAGNLVVNPYLFDVRLEADGVHPVKEREIVRAAGPSVRADLGKQAEGLTPAQVLADAARDLMAAPRPSSAKDKDNDVSI
jgi:Protein of unknown function (DUF2849)